MAGTLPSDAIALTFEDGYVDNLIAGKPRFAAAEVLATVFLATGYLDRPGEFGGLQGFLLLEKRPQEFLSNGPWGIHAFRPALKHSRDDGTMQAALLTGRQAVLTAIWQAIRHEDEERELTMVERRSIFSVRDRGGRGRTLTREEVRALAMDGLLTIGAHTVTHPVLSELGAPACHREIGAPVAGIPMAISMPRLAGRLWPTASPLHVPRGTNQPSLRLMFLPCRASTFTTGTAMHSSRPFVRRQPTVKP